jgi:hypothetical protein
MDSSASHHTTSYKRSLDSVNHVTRYESKIRAADGENHSIKGKGDVKLATDKHYKKTSTRVML